MATKKGRKPASIDVEPDMAAEVFARVHPKAAPGASAREEVPSPSSSGQSQQDAARRAPPSPGEESANSPRAHKGAASLAREQRQRLQAQEDLTEERAARRRADERASEALANVHAVEERAQAAERRAEEAERRAKKAEAQARKAALAGAPSARAPRKRKPRGAVHEELHQIALRLPPGVMAKLEATIAAYGLDRSAGIRVAITEWYVQARAKGLIPEEDEGSGR